MREIFSVRSLKGHKPTYRQIEQAIRDGIVRGELRQGTRLPTVQELAQSYQTSSFTIQSALDALAEDGLIERARRRGTFVTNQTTKLRQVDLYFGRNLFNGCANAFYQRLEQRLSSLLASEAINHRLWVDTRPIHAQDTLMPGLAQAAAKGEMQALIICLTPYPGHPATQKLSKLGVPLAHLRSSYAPYQVWTSDTEAMQMAVRHLKNQGCRSLGAIFSITPSWQNPEDRAVSKTIKATFDGLTNALADERLKTRNRWVQVPDRQLDAEKQEEYGYQSFKKIWAQSDRPDGLIVWPDSVVRGAIMAMLEAGVSVPGDLKLVLHRNSGVPLFCPLPAAWIVTDVDQIAAALLEQVRRQIAQEPVKPILVPQSFEASARTLVE